MSESEKSKLLEMDLYKLFELEEQCSLEQLKKAYRRRALDLHPDKNLDKKEEAEKKFVELGKAFEILADKSARAAYDAVRRQAREKAKRNEQLDDKRKKLKESLEEREKAAKEKSQMQTQAMKKSKEEERLNQEIDRLRREGSKLLDDELNLVNEQIRAEKSKRNISKTSQEDSFENVNEVPPRLKLSWKSSLDSSINEDLIRHLFSKYGQIELLVMSKKSSAILEFKHLNDAVKCLEDEKNLNEIYEINLKWLGPDLNRIKQEKRVPASEKIIQQFDLNSFEEMEKEILKRLKTASQN